MSGIGQIDHPVQMPSSSSFSHRDARASALTSVLLGCGLPAMRLRPPWRWTRERFRLAARCRSAYYRRLRDSARDGRTAMAKGQKRSNREAKKPKADKKKDLASTGTVPNALAKPKPGAATAERRDRRQSLRAAASEDLAWRRLLSGLACRPDARVACF